MSPLTCVAISVSRDTPTDAQNSGATVGSGGNGVFVGVDEGVGFGVNVAVGEGTRVGVTGVAVEEAAAICGLVVAEGDGAMVGAQSGVPSDVPAGAVISGSPAFEHRDWLRSQAVVRKLPQLRHQVQDLERRILQLEAVLRECGKDPDTEVSR